MSTGFGIHIVIKGYYDDSMLSCINKISTIIFFSWPLIPGIEPLISRN